MVNNKVKGWEMYFDYYEVMVEVWMYNFNIED